ncbi:hypothetical protein B5E41_00260 [Rhizobium esperanzae]|uniref:Uncharacterized protein n=1 Tax=Rhizobium esperanzae TaxID=1967781 RepID=A0A246E160_9HYPH|nr:hypothetical protein B5E41_00260 [Rhizobium esperanzae]
MPSPHAAGIPHFPCGSRRGFSCPGARSRASSERLDARTEGIGLTSTDPAFFDDADLADDAGFGNGRAEAIAALQAMLREGVKAKMAFHLASRMQSGVRSPLRRIGRDGHETRTPRPHRHPCSCRVQQRFLLWRPRPRADPRQHHL